MHDWLEEQSLALAALIEETLRTIMVDAVTAYLASMTAAGDSGALDNMDEQWAAALEEEIVPVVSRMYVSGSLGAILSADRKLPQRIMDNWTAVVNEDAVTYARQATNRLVNVGDAMWHSVRHEVAENVAAGGGTEALKATIEGLSGFSEFRADTIARTEVNGAFVNGDHSGAESLGEYGPVEHYWDATLDKRTRPEHADADGQCVPFDESFDVGGESMRYPHDPSASAGNVVNCRCVEGHLYPGDTRPDGSVIEDIDPFQVTLDDDGWAPEMDADEADAYVADSVLQGPRFHGTTTGGEAIRSEGFSSERIGASTGNFGQFGKGFYFTSNQPYAAGYAGSGDLIETRLLVRNPMPQQEFFDTVASEGLTFTREGSTRIAELAQQRGYDAIRVVPNEAFPDFDEIVVFDPKQIVAVRR